MRLVKHKEINQKSWDNLVCSQEHVPFYFLYNYLSSICKWEAIIEEDKNGYCFILPIPFKKRLWIKYFYQPFFCQQLGYLSNTPIDASQQTEVVRLLKKHFHFGEMNWNAAWSEHQDLTINQKPNFILNLGYNYLELQQNYSTNRKRIHKKLLREEIEIVETTNFEAVETTVENFKARFINRIPEIKQKDYSKLLSGLNSIKSQVKLRSIYLINRNEEISSTLVVDFNDRMVYLMGSTADEYKKKGVHSLVFDKLIREHAPSNKILDFEGGASSGIAQFYQSFGAKNTPYFPTAVGEDRILFKQIFR